MQLIILVVYMIVGYWATGVVLYEGKVMLVNPWNFFMKRLVYGIFLGFILIPIAIIKRLLQKR